MVPKPVNNTGRRALFHLSIFAIYFQFYDSNFSSSVDHVKSARYKVTIGISMCPARKDEGVARASSNCQNSPKFALDT